MGICRGDVLRLYLSLEGAFMIPDTTSCPAELWAEIHRLRAELQGPDGHATWKDAAVAERIRANNLQASLDAALRVAPEAVDPIVQAVRIVMLYAESYRTMSGEVQTRDVARDLSYNIARQLAAVPLAAPTTAVTLPPVTDEDVQAAQAAYPRCNDPDNFYGLVDYDMRAALEAYRARAVGVGS